MDQREAPHRLVLRPEPSPSPSPSPSAVPPPVPAAPIAAAPPYPAGSIEAIIVDAAQRHGVAPAWLLRVAACESGLNPRARNASGASGLFQFMPATYYAHGGHDLWDPTEQAEVAATMFAQGFSSAWSCR